MFGPAPSVNSPFIRCGMPQANSTTSTPRWMSPLASRMVLPCSRARTSASFSLSRSSNCRNFISTRARRWGLVAAQAGWAALAFSTAARTSALEASGTREICSPVMGCQPCVKRPEVPATCLPPMKWVSSCMMFPLGSICWVTDCPILLGWGRRLRLCAEILIAGLRLAEIRGELAKFQYLQEPRP